MRVVHLNGPINSGKSTIGQALAALLPDAVFIEGDEHGAPDDLNPPARWVLALDRLARLIATATAETLVIAYPLDEPGFRRLRDAALARGATFRVVTLAPPLTMALADRGRRLTDWERRRIPEMYARGYATRMFSDLILDTGTTTPGDAARVLQDWLG
jgi:hypothetical protein